MITRTFKSVLVKNLVSGEALLLVSCEKCQSTWISRYYPEDLLKFCKEHRCGHEIISTPQIIVVKSQD